MRLIPSEIFEDTFDIVIIGGGINGSGIALDAASRGFKVLLLEKNDFGSGTTSASTKLIHGGLRYLEQFEVGLVRESLREREILLKNAPHLVKPIKLIFPIYKEDKRSFREVRVGLITYDVLSYDKSLKGHKMLKPNELMEIEPSIKVNDLTGGAIFYDCQVVYPERLCLENILMSKKYGAIALNYAKVVDIKLAKKKISGLTFLDVLSNIKHDVKCECIVNVTGPWVDSICQLVDKNISQKIGGTKGSHIVLKNFDNAPKNAVYFSSKKDGRPIFVIPWRDYYLIGTTDTKYDGVPDNVTASENEIRYLLDETNQILPNAHLTKDSILYSYSGIRPLPIVIDLPEEDITRKHLIFDHEKVDRIQGLISIIGGKITVYRSLAKEVVNLLCGKLHHRVRRISCKTEDIMFFSKFSDMTFDEKIQNILNEILKSYNLPHEIVVHLLKFYGKRAFEVIDFISRNREFSLKISSDHEDVIGQIYYAILFENAETALDILLRRTTIGSSFSLGLDSIKKVSEEMGKYFSWSSERINFEINNYTEFINSRFSIK